MNKDELRKIYKEKRNQITTNDFRVLNERLFEKLKTLNWTSVQYLHVFLTITKLKEPETGLFIQWIRLNFPNIKLVISKSNFETGEMLHYLYQDEMQLAPNAWGIPEPIAGTLVDEKLLDVVIVPLLVADKYGNRVGYGKGFYDRFLSKCRSETKTIGISFFDVVEKIDNVSDWDVRLDCCITPNEIYSYKK